MVLRSRVWLLSLVAMIVGCSGLLLGEPWATGAQVPGAEKPPLESLVLSNEALELHFTVQGGQARLSRIENKLARKTVPISDEGFLIGLEGQPSLNLADFVFQKSSRQEVGQGGQRLVLHYGGKRAGLDLEIVYELGREDFFARRWIELRSETPLDLRRVEAWVVGVPGPCRHQGFGEPVFLENTFWGLEFPAGHNVYEEGKVKLVQYPGRRTAHRWTSHRAVVGVAEPGRVVRRFRQYVASFQTTPPETHLFVNYNTWWTLMPPTEQNCLALIETFRKNLFEPFGESFDTFTIDDGWDEKQSLWEIQRERFPRGFAPLVEELKKMNGRLGLWLSPSSGYNHAPWGAQVGYEVNSNPWYLCQSGPKYRRDIVPVVCRLAREYSLAFYKLDGFCATCENAGHGHLPGEYAKEANVEAYIELLEAVRRERPGIFLDPTCGMWLSPWWLRYADAIWGSVSGDYPEIVVPAPIVRDSATTTRDAVFRQRCEEHPGYPPAGIEHLGIIVITPEKWEDNAMIVVGRGCRLLTLYINPSFFTKGEKDWAFLASILRWARHNAVILAHHTELILGDPFQKECYGYAHWRENRGILALRNPFIVPQKVSIPLDATSGWEPSLPKGSGGSVSASVGVEVSSSVPPPGLKRVLARIVYPRQEVLPKLLAYGDRLELELSAYETLMVELEPVEPESTEPVLAGLPVREVRRQDRQIEYELFGQPGQKLSLRLPPGVRTAWLDNGPVSLQEQTGQLLVEFAGSVQECRVENFTQKVIPGSDPTEAWKIQGAGTILVPPGTKAALHILIDPQTPLATPLSCQAEVGDQQVQVRAVRSPEKRQQTHSPHRWTWFEVPLPEGNHPFLWTIQPSKPAVQSSTAKSIYLVGQVGSWLWAEMPRVRRSLRLEFQTGNLPGEPAPRPLPLQMDQRREIISVQPMRSLRAGSRWTDITQAVVRLAQISPNSVEQAWGELQRNRSVWEKPMTIAGQTFSTGLGTHAESRIVYDLAGGRFKKFRARVGRDEHAQDGEVIFQVWLDGRKMFDSGPMRKTIPAQTVEVDVEGAEWLELRTLPGSDGIAGDHGNWAEAELLR